MNKSDFAEILTSLFNGNASEARQISEQMSYDDTFNISDEYGLIIAADNPFSNASAKNAELTISR